MAKKRVRAETERETDGNMPRQSLLSVDGVDRAVGDRLRQLRLAHGLSAREVASRSGITPSHLSRIENAHMSPTVSTIARIAQAIGEPVSRIFGDASEPGPVVRRRARRMIQNRGVLDFLLTPTQSGRLEVLETAIEPGAGSGEPAYSHPGDEECVVVLQGTLTVWLGNARYDLARGDSITFPCRTPHRWTNEGKSQTRVIWIVTPAGGY